MPLTTQLAQRTARLLAKRHTRSLFLKATTPRKMPQDMPPVGGYEEVQYKRNLPAVGYKPSTYLLAMVAIMGYGFYKYKLGVDEWNELAREKIWARVHLVPLLQAEEDRDQVRRMYAEKSRQKELLGYEPKLYASDRFIRPSIMAVPPRLEEEKKEE